MFKLLIKLLLFLLVLALFLPLWMKDPTGRPIMEVDDWLQIPQRVEALFSTTRNILQLVAPPAEPVHEADTAEQPGSPVQPDTRYYRWQDERGRWQFSDQPPPEGVVAQQRELPQLKNALPANLAQQEDTTGAAPPMDSTIAPAVNLPEGVSREAMEQVLEEAHQRRMGEEL